MKNKKLILILGTLVIVAVGAAAYFLNYGTNPSAGPSQKNCTTYGNRVPEQCVEDYIGLSQQEAVDRAKQNGYVAKIVEVDGKNQGVTLEGSTPIYLRIKDGSVVSGYFAGGGQ